MSEQRLLFETPAEADRPCADRAPLTHRGDPPTSYEAARQFQVSGRHAVHRQIALDGVHRCPGGTHSEIAAVTPLDWLQVARRLSELERDGLVRKGEARVCRIKHSRCCTWWPAETDSSSAPSASSGHLEPLESTNAARRVAE